MQATIGAAAGAKAAATVPVKTAAKVAQVKSTAGRSTVAPVTSNLANASYGQLYDQAMSEAKANAASQISSALTPYESQIAFEQKLLPEETNAVQQEFNALLPYAKSAAAYTGQFNTMAANDEQAIFQQAGQDMNTMAQNDASSAQAMAQKIGAPVATNTMGSSLSPYSTALGQAGAVGQLQSLNLGVIGTDNATAWSGQVLPAMALSEEQTLRSDINNEIQKIQSQMATTINNKSSLVGSKLPSYLSSLLTAQYHDQLVKNDKIKTADAFNVAKARIEQADDVLAFNEHKQVQNNNVAQGRLAVSVATADEHRRHDLVTENQGQQKIGQTGVRLEQQQDTLENNAKALGIKTQELQLAQEKFAVGDTQANERIASSNVRNAIALTNAMFGGSSGNKPVTITQRQPLNIHSPQVQAALAYNRAPQALKEFGKVKMPTNVYYDPSSGSWYTWVKQSETPLEFAKSQGLAGTPITDPNAMYHTLQTTFQGSPGVSDQMLQDLVKTRLGLPDWSPGKLASYSPQYLQSMSLNDLKSMATRYGYKPPQGPAPPGGMGPRQPASSLPPPTKADYIDYLTKATAGNR
jgi:hypothetical protein